MVFAVCGCFPGCASAGGYLREKIADGMAKGVSAGEKVSKIMAFFLAKPEIYTLKDLEAKLPKATGLSSMLIPTPP